MIPLHADVVVSSTEKATRLGEFVDVAMRPQTLVCGTGARSSCRSCCGLPVMPVLHRMRGCRHDYRRVLIRLGRHWRVFSGQWAAAIGLKR